MPLAGEAGGVQNPLIRYAVEAGWTHLEPEEALRLRRGETGVVLHDVLVDQLQRLNPGVVDLGRAEEVVRRLTLVAPTIEGNQEAWEFLLGLKTVFVDAERRERNVVLLDPEHVEGNTFHVTEEFRYTNGTKPIRPDVVFLVNGIPVLIVETKAATHVEGIAEALDQIRRYHREGPELMAVLQLHTLTHLIHYYYGATWSLGRKGLFNWRDEQAGDFETLVKTFVQPRRILRILTDFILFTRTDGELSKVVLRPHQMRATERIVERARTDEKRRGLVWHTQGSGKTYTMITVAKRLIEDPAFEHPTVLMIVDRNELEAQLFGNLESAGISGVAVAGSKRALRDMLRHDQRGLIVSMIHKFDDAPEKLNERKNIFVLVDEAHRSTGGDLGTFLMAAVPNATFIGFTGTPIDRTAHGRGTFKVFGTEDERGYLDKYSIRESIADGTTVPLHYQIAESDLLPDKETMEAEFWRTAELEGVSDIEELDRVLDQAVTLKNMLKNPDRVEKVAAYVAKHFRETVEPMGYKAFLVAVDREACTLYKEALDRYLDSEESVVIISAGHNDTEQLARYHLSGDEEQRIRKAFRKPDEQPKILIVTEKLLTGFDAPILYAMYLDKPMRDHVLLQAIARVNRPYESGDQRKPAGLVVDFVSIFDNLERALAFDSEDVDGVIEGLDLLKQHFEQMMSDGRADYLTVIADKRADKAIEAVLEHFRDREIRHEFYSYFRELQELYEILSPDPFLRPFLRDYEDLGRMYQLLRSNYEPGVTVDRSFMRKTAEIVQQNTTTTRIRDDGAEYVIDASTIEALANDDRSDTVKVFNLLKSLRNLVADRSDQEPHLRPIGERVEQIAREFELRLSNAQQALEALQGVLIDLDDARVVREESGLSVEAAAVAWLLSREGIEDAESVASEIEEVLTEFPHWRAGGDQDRTARRRLYGVFARAGKNAADSVHLGEIVLNMLRGSR